MIDAMKEALNALEWMQPLIEDYGSKEQRQKYYAATVVLRQAIEKAEMHEPVAWRHWIKVDGEMFPQLTLVPRTDKDDPLYTALPRK